MTDEQIATVYDALIRHKVLAFKKIGLNHEQQVRFTHELSGASPNIGAPTIGHTIFGHVKNYPEIFSVYQGEKSKPRDLERLAKHFVISVGAARRRFTKQGLDAGERVLRHKKDEHYGTVCQFLDSDTRQCTIYSVRPQICRIFPGTVRCGYYDFLTFERRMQDDSEYVSTTFNK